MEFSNLDRHSSLWMTLKAYLLTEVEEHRDNLERVNDPVRCEGFRGQIRACRKLLELVEPPVESVEPENEVNTDLTGSLYD